ncbi:F-box/RNI-like superfamily protein [Rhynchospora pubera]|uniref:F-box/RNI-like superfamily protein n=1 Tax=Rhynchospora pubera TaxID=906938 RepID=A0AAV8GLK3_9POAL|nr:F-box/RNI-like superfamily protein [Rhynchospora pubera]
MAGADRISELHDSILTRILSYLTTKEAVRTRSLSKRWRNVWASVPVLDFDSADFWSHDIPSGRSEQIECQDNFVKIIDAVLALRQVQQVDRFRLVWKYQVRNYPRHGHPLRRWIPYVVQQLPRVLSLYLEPLYDRLEIPDLIFTCSSLEEMKLQFDCCWLGSPHPPLVTLPHLRKLYLGRFFISTNFMDKLLLGCPSLEELELHACCLFISQISCGNLKSLVLNGCYPTTEIEVSIPSLQYLKVTVMSSQKAGYIFKNMSSLVKASICLFAIHQLGMHILNSEAKILTGLLGITTLDVVLYGLRAKDMLEHILKTCPYFGNLKFMHFESFDGSMAGCIDMLNRLIQHSPALKELTFYRCQDVADDETDLIRELRKLLLEYGIVELVERHQGSTYGSLSELEKLSNEHTALVELIYWPT